MNKIEKILNDNKSGSAQLHEKIVNFLIAKIAKNENISEVLEQIKSEFYEFAIITNLIKKLEKTPAAKRLQVLEKEANSISKTSKKIYEKLKNKLFDGIKIVTISNSGTLAEIFEFISKDFQNAKIFVSESRPVNEGVIMADIVASFGLQTTLITEAMIPEYVAESDLALTGADKILADGSAVNKIGTKILALACKYYEKPFYVLCGKNKFSDEKDFSQKPHPISEIIKREKSKFSVATNYYFEKIEKELITEIITD